MSNKKFSRSKKSDGGNVPNFVFNFSGSQPGSPLASPGGFSSTPGSPAQTGTNFGSNTSQSFSFGDSAATSSTPTNAFNFNSASTTTNSPFNTKRGQSELDLSAPERNPIRRAASDSAFGGPASTSQSFTFGANAATSGLTSQLSFGSTGSQSSNLSFSTPATTTNTPSAPSAPSGISFGAPPAAGTNTSTPSKISFGTPATSATNTSSTPTGFTFGSVVSAGTSSIPTSAPTSAFSFGTPASKPATSINTPSFVFGASTITPSTTANSTTTTAEKPSTPAPTSGLSFGTTPAIVTSTPAASSTGLLFGKPADTTKPATTSTPTLSFGLSSISTAPSTTSTTTSTADKPATTAPTSTTSPFSFSTPKTTGAASSTPTISFGGPSTDAASTPAASTSTSTTTTSSSTSTAAPSAPTSSLFSLGTVTSDKDGKKAGTVTSAPLLFGAGATPTTTSALTIPAADPNKPNVFSFSKILEDLRKVEAQPPHQMYVSLITPALAALQQNQIVSHTSFRIDNILPSTRFSELPEQAQKELDELEKYVRLEAQRCEYIGNQKQLEALTCTLKNQMESTKSFYEGVKNQIRHANEGCAVIEACKHPGDNARWLFGHSEDDDYFSLLAKQLDRRLEEYKKCIWEIERTAQSWAHNRMQSPQDVADIMRAQNQAFLALSNKVAALHESVNVEMNYYNQYLRMCS
ncbi:hypothetical protein INT48_007302 [Thamnidium elegans]|uniref:Uncharacterized protein n=1 Tax=Thamnidium elegans TaxID=101142 RepID=A0A8H7SQ45_9FUNG|nr:hypothetical protein INT48_007302 [Thamnidium elegans]